MKYILIFSVFWVEPYTHWKTIQVEPFYSLNECLTAGRSMWQATRRDGAVAYLVNCKTLHEMEA